MSTSFKVNVMLSGTDLNYAYAREFEQHIAKPAAQQKQSLPSPEQPRQPPITPPAPAPPAQPEAVPLPAPLPSNMDSPLLTSDEKLYLLSSELKRQRDMLHQQSNAQPGYVDKMWTKKRDVLRLVMFTFVFMLALSFHWVAKHYLKAHLEANLLSPGKEFLLRAAYPLAILFIVWNLRVFNK